MWSWALGLVVAAAVVVPSSATAAFDAAPFLAPSSVCEHQRDLSAGPRMQERAMKCMTNFARRHAGLAPLRGRRVLDRSARHKARDILRCDSFSHSACGRGFTYWMGRLGYLRARCWWAGENLAWAPRRLSSPRSVLRAWLHSTHHRENVLSRRYRRIGVELAVGRLGHDREAHIWVQHFGAHC